MGSQDLLSALIILSGVYSVTDVCRFRLHRTGSVEIVDKEISDVLDTSKDNHSDLVKGHNPWSLHCHKEQLSRRWRQSQAAGPDSILLEIQNRHHTLMFFHCQ